MPDNFELIQVQSGLALGVRMNEFDVETVRVYPIMGRSTGEAAN